MKLDAGTCDWLTGLVRPSPLNGKTEWVSDLDSQSNI